MISEVLNALDGSILANMEVHEEGGKGDSLRNCINACLWDNVNERIREYADTRTLGDLLAECRSKAAGGWDMYVI